MLIPIRPALNINKNLKKAKIWNSSRYREGVSIYFTGRFNMYSPYIRYDYSLILLLSSIAKHPLLILIKGDLAPLGKALSWVNWKDSWIAWHLNQNTQLTHYKLNQPCLELSSDKVVLNIGNNRTVLFYTENQHMLHVDSNIGFNSVIIAAKILWQAQLELENSTYAAI